MLGYLGVWIAFGLLLSGVMFFGGNAPANWSLMFSVPLAVLLGLQSLSFWYLVQLLPPDRTPPMRMALLWLAAGIISLSIWLGIAYGWAQFLLPAGETYPDGAFAALPLMVFAGGIAITLAVLGHYLLWAFQRSREAERRALESQVLQREAELKSLRAQLDPHFLFNSLNSVAALIGNDTVAARHMCFLMAQFFRKSLTLGREKAISLADEISLAETFLAIERVRFGERLRANFDIADDVRMVSVPPLMLQPLVENAVHHGVAHLLEGGEVIVRARRRDNFVELVVENPCDPDRPPSRSTGVGLVNVRSRVETLCGHRASVDVDAGEEHFRVSILLPAAAATS
ncbi:signal transduction histidine kinase [Povalibacter uvarum]|uniref:Signal transduction histidine kinase n=1 Tax=Povalibacter uvarum TaxID=732238 RepID=A0A841HKL3_9GAMM|nr:histidine kinase [Povalibacter uvarum]MBB6092662.1 signal transduction histidine kinase [Povalibacter uvarum]